VNLNVAFEIISINCLSIKKKYYVFKVIY